MLFCVNVLRYLVIAYYVSSDIWKIYLEQKNYEMAKRYAIGNREHMDVILVSQAEHYFKEQRCTMLSI